MIALVLAACVWQPEDLTYEAYLAGLDTGLPEGFGACSTPVGEPVSVAWQNREGPLVEVVWIGEDCSIVGSAVLFSDTPAPRRDAHEGDVYRVRTASTSPDHEPSWLGEHVVTRADLDAGTLEVD
ncbi:MAG: hypothetical protein R3F61_15390 [Myxococcota bacterium]